MQNGQRRYPTTVRRWRLRELMGIANIRDMDQAVAAFILSGTFTHHQVDTIGRIMHIYHLGMSSLSLPASAAAEAAAEAIRQDQVMDTEDERPEENLIDDRTWQQHHKRPRETPRLSPSPASVLVMASDDSGMMAVSSPTAAATSASMDTPAIKRQRHHAWLGDPTTDSSLLGTSSNIIHHNINNNNNNSVVSPDEQDRMCLARNTVACERQGQYEWWKTPPAAPPLLPSTTMGLAANAADASSSVMGCNACQRLFIPPTIPLPPSSLQIQHNTLLNYFTPTTASANNNMPKLKPTPSPAQVQASATTVIDKRACLCTFCERTTCGKCLRACEQCRHSFCTLCSTQTFVSGGGARDEEATLCLDCASMLDLPETTTGIATISTMEE